MVFLAYALVVVGSYLLGSIPTGFLVARSRGIDIRNSGSGNIGATNVFRTLGKRAGIGVLLGDALKGWLAVKFLALAVELLINQPGDAAAIAAGPSLHGLELAAGVAAILGHNYTCWLGFKGGKGIATSGGVLIAWLPQPFLILLCVWLGVFAISRYVSLASIVAAVALPVATWWLDGRTEMVVITALLSVLAIYKHRVNIQRLANGTENRFVRKQPTAATGGGQ